MTALVVQGDLLASAEILARLKSKEDGSSFDTATSTDTTSATTGAHVVILSGFPCCVTQNPPTETDGPPGTFAIAFAAVGLGHKVTVVTDKCNHDVFRAAMKEQEETTTTGTAKLNLVAFPDEQNMSPTDYQDLKQLALSADLVIACERAGPAADGQCYTMRGINMNEKGLIAPLHQIVEFARENNKKFIAIGDGGNEMGMGKVIESIHKHIPKGEMIGAVTVADHLVAASVSNWGGYALAAAAALVRCNDDDGIDDEDKGRTKWVEQCVPTEIDEVALLERCVKAGCRDGVSGEMEATVDGMPLETSMKCLRDIRDAALNL